MSAKKNVRNKANWVYFERVAVNLAALKSDRPRLDPDVKKAWIDALWFGFYKQAPDVLCNTIGNLCCLGVKHIIEGDSNEFILLQTDYFGKDKNILGPTGYFGFLVVWDGQNQVSLAELNDSGATFREIAFVIEHIF